VSKSSVDQAVDRWRYAAPRAAVVQRRCLRCRQMFDSPSQGIRLCKLCKASDEFSSIASVQI